MTDFMPAGIVADLRTLSAHSLPDRATNGRTHVTTDCRVNADTRDVHVEGLPSTTRLRRWRLTLPDGTDAQPADLLTVAANATTGYPGGTYRVLGV